MKKATLPLILASLAFMLGATPNDRTHYYTVEYRKAIAPNPIAMVMVTFYRPVSDDFALRLLKAELQTAIDLYPPKDDVLVSAWYHRPGTDESDDKEIGNDDDYPCFCMKDGKIVTFKDRTK